MQKQIFQMIAPEGDQELLAQVASVLSTATNFVLWLQGPMGAGKTSFVRHYLYYLGLSPETPVVSPTYTIMNEYCLEGAWYAHLDLYRADINFSLDELGVRDYRDYRGIFIEWPEQAGHHELLQATHSLAIESADGLRSYTFGIFVS